MTDSSPSTSTPCPPSLAEAAAPSSLVAAPALLLDPPPSPAHRPHESDDISTPLVRESAALPPGERPASSPADRAAFVLLAWLFVAQAAWVYGPGAASRVVDVDRLPARRFDLRLDVNQATLVELLHLPGVGPTLAERIIADREANGYYRNLADLDRVPGMGPKTLERVGPYLSWASDESPNNAPKEAPGGGVTGGSGM
ncbi:MAG: ComEA family DNA-binding protein [Planctomycetia bacterium]